MSCWQPCQSVIAAEHGKRNERRKSAALDLAI
jgi:hypothetical protein